MQCHLSQFRWPLAVGLAVALSIVAVRRLPAAPPPPAAPSMTQSTVEATTAGKTEPESLLRGPIHEAFASPLAGDLKPGVVIKKSPPQAIREQAPDMRPAGDNVVWIPGYWAWDDAQNDFVWVSGVWRNAPQGRRWVPGYWAQADGGHRWIAGMWVDAKTEETAYQPVPPESLERGPTSPAPGDNYFWVSGCWMYGDNGYAWRAGYWAQAQDGWCWIPDSYCWTPSGVVFIHGYWDYPFVARGTLFAPVFFGRGFGFASYVYTPSIVVDVGNLHLHLFLRPDCHHYYFGDYYGASVAQFGFLPWFEFNSFHRGYDPLLTYYSREQSRQGIDAVKELRGWHSYFTANSELRPPHTMAALSTFTTRNKGSEYVKQSLLGQPLKQILASGGTGNRFLPVTAEQRQSIAAKTNAVESLAKLRSGLEMQSGPPLAGGTARRHTVLKLPAMDEGPQGPAQRLKLPIGPIEKVPEIERGLLPGGNRLLTPPKLDGKTPLKEPSIPGVERIPTPFGGPKHESGKQQRR